MSKGDKNNSGFLNQQANSLTIQRSHSAKLRAVLLAFAAQILAVGLLGAANAQSPNPVDYTSVPEKEDQILMRIGHSVSIEWSTHTATLKRFAELVAIYSDNRIKPEMYGGAQLGGEREMVQQTRLNVLQVTFPATNNLSALSPSMNLFVLPYLAENTDEINHLQDVFTPRLNERLIAEAGVRIVGWENAGWRSFYYSSKDPIEVPQDLARLKMRVPPNPVMIATYEAWGANPIPLAWKELYGALQQGVVEGGDNPINDVIGMRFHEVTNRMTKLHYTILTHPILVSEKWFQDLDPDLQRAVLRAGEEATEYIRWWQPIDESRWWDQAADEGVIVTQIADESEWAELARATWPDFYDKIGPDGEELVGEALRILETYRAAQ